MGGEIVISDSLKQGLNLLVGLRLLYTFLKDGGFL